MEGDVVATIKVEMSNPSNRNQQFRFVRSGSADDADATLASPTATVLDHQLERTVDLIVREDNFFEPDETVVVALESVLVAYEDQRDISSVVGAPSVATVTILDDDRRPPETTIIDAPAVLVASTSASVSFTSDEPDATFECDIDDAGFAPCAPPVTYSALADGSHHFVVRASAAGLVDPTPASTAWVVDATGPVVTVDVPTASAVFTVGQLVAPVVTCVDALDASPVLTLSAIDTSSPSPSRVFTASCRDAAGNVTSVSRQYSVTAPPSAAATLQWSSTANRSSARPLLGSTLSGDVAVFLTTPSGSTAVTGVRSVTFRLLDGGGHVLVCTFDRQPAFDFVGSIGSSAIRVPTTLVRNGTYRMDADIAGTNGSTNRVSATFAVDNGRRGPLAHLISSLLAVFPSRC